jgi:hypothetical protein
LLFLLVALIGMGVAEIRRRSDLREHERSMGTPTPKGRPTSA